MQNVKVTRKGKRGPIPARIFFILARTAPFAAVFRRGPSRWVQLLKWNTDTDEFEFGQWFHGRVYERRSDLSPDGSLLVYFANKINERTLEDESYTYAWTAVSRPPFLTALALWPKGDCWHGGGLFRDNRTLLLNHRRDTSTPHPDHRPKALHVVLKDKVSGEDDPIFSERLERDGWVLEQHWEVENRGYPQMYLTAKPEIRERVAPDGKYLLRMTRSISGLDYSEEFEVVSMEHALTTTIENASWADFDQRGRLVFARDGKILTGRFGRNGTLVPTELADLNSSTPAQIPPPEWAMSW